MTREPLARALGTRARVTAVCVVNRDTTARARFTNLHTRTNLARVQRTCVPQRTMNRQDDTKIAIEGGRNKPFSIRVRMSRAHIRKTSSTLSPVRALVSRKVMPDSCANLLTSKNVTCLCEVETYGWKPQKCVSSKKNLCQDLKGERANIGSQVSFVANEDERDVRVSHCARVVEPRADMVVRVTGRHVVDKKSTCRAAIIAPGHGTETVLPSRVPDLQLHCFAADVHDLASKLDTDGVGRVLLDCRDRKQLRTTKTKWAQTQRSTITNTCWK